MIKPDVSAVYYPVCLRHARCHFCQAKYMLTLSYDVSAVQVEIEKLECAPTQGERIFIDILTKNLRRNRYKRSH